MNVTLTRSTMVTLDARLNGTDTVGDEGEPFRRLLAGERFDAREIAAIRAGLDGGTIVVDELGVPPAEQPLFVVVAALDAVGSTPPSTASFRLLLSDPDDPAGNNSTERFELSHDPTREIGQVTYRDALEASARESVVDRSTPPETTLTRIVFARGAGLVEFERSDGETFTLVPP